MKKILKPVLLTAIIILSLFLSLSIFNRPSPQPLTADDGEFSAERAMEHVEMIASDIHPIGSEQQKASGAYIWKTLEDMGLKPEMQKGHVENDAQFTSGLVPYSGEAENIYVRFEGTEQHNRAILMIAHYDSTLTGPGAADDASGAAALLETVRVLSLEEPLKNDLIFLFADGEEAELLGSKLFAGQSGKPEDVEFVFNFEAMGNRGPSFLFETSEGNAWLINEFQKAVPYPLAFSFSNDIYRLTSNITDFMPFKEMGKKGLNFAILGGSETYHNPQDNPENLDRSSLQHQGSYILSLARHFGNMQSGDLAQDGNAIYFTVMKSVMVFYAEKWVLPFTAFALLLFLITLWCGVRKQIFSMRGVLYGFLGSVLMLIVAVGFGIIIQNIFLNLYFNLDNIKELSDLVRTRRTVFLNGYWWMLAGAILYVLLLYVMQRFFRRRITLQNLFMGSMGMWLLFAVTTAFPLKGTGYIFLWPLILSLVGLLIDFYIIQKEELKYLTVFAMCTVSCSVLYIPVGYMLGNALSMTAAGILLPLMSLPMSLFLMTMSMYCEKRLKWQNVR